MDRAYSLWEIKSVEEESRIIEGLASTPQPDRDGDIMEPGGAEFILPMPLLWQHKKDQPIGHVISARVTSDGIWIRAQIAKLSDPCTLKDTIDSAWAAIKAKLVCGFSVGFLPGDRQPIPGTYGTRWKTWRWLETSTVTIPSNSGATLAMVKSADSEILAASGREHRRTTPGASGSVRIIPPKPRGGNVKTIQEQISDFENTRAAKAARKNEIQTKAVEGGRTKDDAEREEFDTLTDELKSIDRELVDLRQMETENVAQAKAVVTTVATKAVSDQRATVVVTEREEKLEKGIEFARFAMCVGKAKGDLRHAVDLARHHYPKQMRAIALLDMASKSGDSVEGLVTKAAVAAGTTTDATWAAPLLAYNVFAGDFLEFLRPQTIIGRFGADGVPSLRRIPFNVHIKGQTSGGTGYWVGQGAPKPVTKFDFIDAYHGFTKVAAIAVLTEELIRFSDPSAERLVRDALAGCLIERMDEDFIDPAITVTSGVRPASITNGVTPITSSGDDGDAVRADIQALWADSLAANLPMTSAVYVTTPTIALALSLMMNALGQREFPDMSMTGGTLLGVKVIVSNYVPTGLFILVFASEIYLSDDGAVSIDASREASIQMLDNPTNNPTGGTVATSLVSMFQTDSVALRAHRFVNWSKRRTTAVALLEDVAWGQNVVS